MKKSRDYYFEQAALLAIWSKCDCARCGAVVVAEDGEIIGKGYNAPPLEDEKQRFCQTKLSSNRRAKYDRTCCVHAEWNAIIDALKNHGSRIDGGTLYFMRVDRDGCWMDAGEPFCTVCSRLAMQSGLKTFALWSDERLRLYSVADYNRASYKFFME